MPKSNEQNKYNEILDRLLKIITYLNEGRVVNKKELAEEFGVTEKTIQRYINERLVNLIPIERVEDGYKSEAGFLEKITSLESKIIFNILDNIVDEIGGKFVTRTKKVLSKIRNEEFSPIYTKLNIEDISDKFNEVKLLEKAIKEKNIITCNYDTDLGSLLQSIELKPLKIANYDGFWYLLALDGEILKKYYLKKVSNLKITDKTFQVENSIEELLENSISIWFRQDVEPFEVKIYADKIAAKYFKRSPLPIQTLESAYSDGSIEFVIKITHAMEIIPIIQSWLPHLCVISPKEIADEIDENIENYKILQKNLSS